MRDSQRRDCPPKSQYDAAAVTSFYLGEGEHNKDYTAKHFGITPWYVSKALLGTGHPEEAYQCMVARYPNMPTPPQDIDYIRSRWGEFLKSLRGEGFSGHLDAFLRSACDPVALEDNTLVLGFYYPFHKEKIEDERYRSLVEQRLVELFGHPYKIRCILVQSKREVPAKADTQTTTGTELVNSIDILLGQLNQQLNQLRQVTQYLQTLKTLILDYGKLRQRCDELEEENRKHIAKRVELQNLLSQPD